MPSHSSFRPADLIVARRTVMEIVDGGLALVRIDFAALFSRLLFLFVPVYAIKAALYGMDWIEFDRIFGTFNWFHSASYTPGNLLHLLLDVSVQWTAAAMIMSYWDGDSSQPAARTRRIGKLILPLCRINTTLSLIIIAGLLLGVIGGVVLYLLFLMSTPIIILERQTSLQSVWRRSEFLMKDNWGRGLGLTAVSLLLLSILGVSLTYLTSGAYQLIVEQIAWLSGVLPDVDMVGLFSSVLISVVLLPMQNVFILLFYYDLRSRKEGLDLDRLTDDLEQTA